MRRARRREQETGGRTPQAGEALCHESVSGMALGRASDFLRKNVDLLAQEVLAPQRYAVDSDSFSAR